MIVHDCIQGTTEWLSVRAGIPTASMFDQIITPKTGKLSTSSEGYMLRLLAERILKRPIEQQAFSGWMDRGSAMESDAVAFYEFQRSLDTVKVGFITNDAGTIGASPDRLVGDDGLLEIKCPSEAVHMGYLLHGSLGEKHRPRCRANCGSPVACGAIHSAITPSCRPRSFASNEMMRTSRPYPPRWRRSPARWPRRRRWRARTTCSCAVAGSRGIMPKSWRMGSSTFSWI